MLHYFAKKIFGAKILSAYIEHDNMSLYYINDDIHRQRRQFDNTQTRLREFGSSDAEQMSSSLGDVPLHLSHSISVLESRLKRSPETSEEWLRHRQETSVKDDNREGDVDDFSPLHQLHDHCTVTLQCFGWNSFEPRAKWNITFPQVCVIILLYYIDQ